MGGVATLQSYYQFAAAFQAFDESGLAAVTHRLVWRPYYQYLWQTIPKLSLLEPRSLPSGNYQERSRRSRYG